MRKILGSMFGAACFFTLASPASAGVIFSDNFNMGPNRDVVGNGWIEYDPSDPMAANIDIIQNTLRIRSSTNSGALDAAAYQSLSTLGFTNVVLNFTYRTAGSETPDVVGVDWRIGTGSWMTTTDIASQTFPLDGITDPTAVAFNLGPLADNQANIEFRFFINIDALNPVPRPPGPDTEGARIDDVVLTGDAIAVPEPLTLSLFGAGLAAAVAVRRRKQAA